ncbi:MAG: type II toxin-antitoxin system VapC family toxin [Bacteroidota bacterium]
MKYFLDTNICIYFLKGLYPSIKDKFQQINPNDIKIPSIVKAELLYGIEKSVKKKNNLELVNNFLFPFEIVPFDSSAAEFYSKIRSSLEKSGSIIGPNDLIIASIVAANKGTLISNNEKEFKRIKNLQVKNWI